MSGVNFTSSAPKRSRSSSPVEDALESITFTSPKRVLSWWWSTFSTMGESWSTSGSGPSRLSFAQSTAMRMRWSASGGTRRSSPSSFMNAYSPGSGASPTSSICVSLPSCSSASAVASIEPSASPSGFSCVVTRKRSPPRIAAAAWASSVSIVVVWGELIDQLGHPDPPLDRWIVFERQLGSAFHPQLAREERLQHSVRSCETLQAALALALRAEHRDEDAGVTEIGRRLDAGDRDEPDPRVLQLGERRSEYLLDRLVHSSHPLSHPGPPPRAPRTRARTPGCSGIEPRPRAAPRARGARARHERP